MSHTLCAAGRLVVAAIGGDGAAPCGLIDQPPWRAVATAAFALVGVLCLWTWLATRRLPMAVRGRTGFFWLLSGALLLILAANRHFELQGLVAVEAHPPVVVGAVHAERRLLGFALAVVIGCTGFAAFALLALAPARQAPVLALAGLVALLCEVPLMALSMYQIDGVLARTWGLLSLRTALELAALGCIGMSAVGLLLTHRHARGEERWDPLGERGLR